eukprot:GFYU01019097.1.p1 GENE.GFYU01019097.1~~GFYU01019097.1.p1  ORF type:complete len:140 (-),score=27.58 GFYU01019097.1:139-558(-)
MSVDAFDALLDVEDQFYQEGIEHGIAAGKKAGLQEGFRLGLAKGESIGREIGFIAASVAIIATFHDNEQLKSRMTEKVCKTLATLTDLLERFPYTNPLDDNIIEMYGSIRAKYKVLTSALGLPLKYEAAREGERRDITF